MDDPVHLVDEDARRRDFFQDATVQRSFAESDARAHVPPNKSGLVANSDGPEQTPQKAWLVASSLDRLINAGVAVDGAEHSGRIVGGFGCTKQQKRARIERIVKGVAHLVLQISIEVDQDVAAGNQVDMGEWRVLEQVMQCEQDRIAQLLADPVAVAFADEESPQA